MPTTDAKIKPIQEPNRPQMRTHQPQYPTQKKSLTLRLIITFIIMLGFWLLFSGKFDFFHISLGVVSCLIVSATSSRLLFPNSLRSSLVMCWIKFAAYLPWLFYQIFLANLHVLYLSFHPRMMDLINPKIIEFDTRLKSDVSRTTLANSITLTPGTITIYAGIMGTFAVHCINDKSGQDLPGDMESKIAKVFDE